MKLDTIGKKLMIPITALMIILLVGLGTTMILNSQSSIGAMMDSKGNSLANLLEKISTPYIVNFDFPALEGFVEEAIKDPDVAFVAFTDGAGKLLTKNSQMPADTSMLSLYQREIKDSSGEKLAALTIGYSREALSRILRDGVLKISISVLMAMALTLVGLVFVTRNITGILKRVIAGMSEGTDTVASVSSQVASASQALAGGASQQASGIEEASASVEEMASMTRQNADNAGQANSMMAETRKVMDMANQSMADLTTAMGDISNASQETAKIIKTIDEIAFQTNLLALNAAVEAARAGEAGAGFAVVADEVRNLAIRAAEAAKNTAALIEGTVKKIQLGSGIVAKTNEAFSTVADGARKVGELVEEISAASNEQAQGVQQINRAIAEMEKVVQVNAAGAEESASAAQEMNAQAERMRQHVGDLMKIVGGGRNGTGAEGKGGPRNERSVSPRMQALPEKRTGRSPAVVARPSRKGVDPEQVIPLKDGEFRDF